VAGSTSLIKDRLLVFLDFSGLIGGHTTATVLLLAVIAVDYLLHVVTASQLILLIVSD
jgi:hypothetical protein